MGGISLYIFNAVCDTVKILSAGPVHQTAGGDVPCCSGQLTVNCLILQYFVFQ